MERTDWPGPVEGLGELSFDVRSGRNWWASRSARLRHLLARERSGFSSGWTRRNRIALAVSSVLVAGVLLFNAWIVSCGFRGCPSAADIRAYRPTEGGRILDRRGTLLGKMVAVRRENVALETVPEHVRDAFLVTEDRRFYQHHGLDWRAVARATARNITSLSFREGFSTITMQLARNSFIPSGRTGSAIGRKLLELRLSRLIEKTLTKDEILELYLNAIYLGGGVYGVQGASRDLFDKSVANLSIAEGALLAALPKAPSVYNPRLNADRARERRDLVISLMRDAGVIDSSKAAKALETKIKVANSSWGDTGNEPSALTAVRSFVDSLLEAHNRSGEEVFVHTTLDATAQRAADNAVTRRAAVIQRESDNWYGGKKGDIQGAMVAIDARTGDILALVGAGKYERGGFNRALYARRQPGSAFKPFVYAAAIERGFTPATLVDDEPISIPDQGKTWTPSNYGGEYFGTVTLRTALMRSANAATIRLSRAVGERNIVEIAHRSGIESNLTPVPAIALGALEVTPLELTAAYAPFANGGYRVKPRLVTRIESHDGGNIWVSASEQTQVMDVRDAFLVTSMLRSVVDEGTGTAVRSYGARGVLAGKTGTSNDATDVWFVGYTPTIVAGFWFGYDTPRMISGGANGGRHAAPAWAEFYRNGWRERDIWRGWDVPRGLVRQTIDEETGFLANGWCPHVRDEWFKVGTEPTDYCETHAWDFGSWLDRTGRNLGATIRGFIGGRRDTSAADDRRRDNQRGRRGRGRGGG